MTKRRVPGITVYRPYTLWAYRLELEPDPLTGSRRRENRSGFATEDEAWAAALSSQAAHTRGRHVKPMRRNVHDYLSEWLDTVRDALKPTTYQNYSDYINAYVVPTLGKRRLQDLTVPVLNAGDGDDTR